MLFRSARLAVLLIGTALTAGSAGTISQTSNASAEQLEAAERLAREGRIEAALEAYRELVRQHGAAPAALLAIAELEIERENWDDAGAAVDQALPLLSGAALAAARKMRGQIHFQLKQYDRAAQAWQQAAQDLPHDFELWQRLGQFYLNLGPPRSAEAIATLEHAVELEPERALLRLDLGLAYERAGRSSDARRQYLRATQLAPDQPQAWTSLGILEARLNENEAAERHLRLALRADPEHAAALFELGNLLRRRGDIDEARALLERYRALHQERAPRPLEDDGLDP